MGKLDNTGSLDFEYAKGREAKGFLRYRLWRRTHEVLSAIEEFAKNPAQDVIDLGTADARMLNMVHQKYPQARCVGVEYSKDLVDFAKAKFPHLEVVQGDVRSLDFPDNSFDVAIAAAVIEHVSNPLKMMSEVKRILRPSGIFVLTSPDPFWEHVAVLIGHLKKGQHKTVMNLRQLRDLAKMCGFVVLKSQKFMLLPAGIPFEFIFEKIIRNLNLDFLMVNQLLIACS